MFSFDMYLQAKGSIVSRCADWLVSISSAGLIGLRHTASVMCMELGTIDLKYAL
jgi:hypothetical protein